MKAPVTAFFALVLVAGMALVVFPQTILAPESSESSLGEESITLASTTVLFGGDMMFDRSVRVAMQEHGEDSIFSCIDQLLRSVDLVVANLEGPITNNPSVSVGSAVGARDNYQFTFAPSVGNLLVEHGILLVNLGNNHILNFGESGLVATKKYLGTAGVEYFGDPLSHKAVATTLGGVPLAFINYNEFTPKTYGGASGSASTTLAQIRKAKMGGYLPIVYTHWGVEYATTSPAYVQELAHAFVDAGAVLVVGSHPHVVEEHEVYKGATIYYSLGNFIFDQYFSDDVTHGLLLKVYFTNAGVSSVEEIPVQLTQDRRTCPVVETLPV